jgi:PAS domain S-box-containing protein
LINPVAEELTGWKEAQALGQPIEEVFVVINEKTRKHVANPVIRVLSTGTICGLANHTLLVAKDGTERSIADSGEPIRDSKGIVVGVVLVFRDTTEEQHMLREAAKAEKLESVGFLAGGIAHDFNNILAGIMGNVSLAKIHMDPKAQGFKRLSAAERAVGRAKDLTQQLLTFSKGGAPIKKAASLQQLLAEWAGFAQGLPYEL